MVGLFVVCGRCDERRSRYCRRWDCLVEGFVSRTQIVVVGHRRIGGRSTKHLNQKK